MLLSLICFHRFSTFVFSLHYTYHVCYRAEGELKLYHSFICHPSLHTSIHPFILENTINVIPREPKKKKARLSPPHYGGFLPTHVLFHSRDNDRENGESAQVLAFKKMVDSENRWPRKRFRGHRNPRVQQRFKSFNKLRDFHLIEILIGVKGGNKKCFKKTTLCRNGNESKRPRWSYS